MLGSRARVLVEKPLAAARACVSVMKPAGGRLDLSHALPSVLRESLPLGSR